MSGDPENSKAVPALFQKQKLPIEAAYKDVIQPAAHQVGLAGETVGRLVNSVLRPLQSLGLAWDLMFDRLDNWLTERLKDIDPEKIVPAPTSISGKILTGLVFAQDERQLREMFVSLLASSMHRDLQSRVHPSFATILSELTPDEAKIVQHIQGRTHIPVVRVRSRLNPTLNRVRSFERAQAACLEARCLTAELYTLMGSPEYRKRGYDHHDPDPWESERLIMHLPSEMNLQNPDMVPTYLDNMLRNRLVHVYFDNAIVADDVYHEVENSPLFTEISNEMTKPDHYLTTQRSLLTVTDFGSRFLSVCVVGPQATSRRVERTPTKTTRRCGKRKKSRSADQPQEME